MKRTGISNRMTPAEEERERREHPPAYPARDPEPVADEAAEGQTTHAGGTRSGTRQEAEESADRPEAPVAPKPGTFGRASNGGADSRNSARNRGASAKGGRG